MIFFLKYLLLATSKTSTMGLKEEEGCTLLTAKLRAVRQMFKGSLMGYLRQLVKYAHWAFI